MEGKTKADTACHGRELGLGLVLGLGLGLELGLVLGLGLGSGLGFGLVHTGIGIVAAGCALSTWLG